MSIDSQHTPGPWNIRGDAYQIVANYDADTHEGSWREHYDVICTFEDEFGEPALEARANARLIAAAPDLLALVREVLSDELASLAPGTIERAEAAIAKATGRAP